MTKKPAVNKARGQRKNTGATKVQREAIAATISELNSIRPTDPKTIRVLGMFKEWLSDESGYDEAVLPRLKKAMNKERDRVGARRLFDD